MPIISWDEEKRDINVKQCKVPVVTLFSMPACAPCRQIEHDLELLENEFKGKVVFGKCRADEYTGQEPISSVPRIFITTFGRIYEQYGVISADKLRARLEEAIEEMEDMIDEREETT